MKVIDLKNYMQRLCNEGKAEDEVTFSFFWFRRREGQGFVDDFEILTTSAETPLGSLCQSPPAGPDALASLDLPQTSQRSGKLPEDLPPE